MSGIVHIVEGIIQCHGFSRNNICIPKDDNFQLYLAYDLKMFLSLKIDRAFVYWYKMAYAALTD